jgi:hypothetical protein
MDKFLKQMAAADEAEAERVKAWEKANEEGKSKQSTDRPFKTAAARPENDVEETSENDVEETSASSDDDSSASSDDDSIASISDDGSDKDGDGDESNKNDDGSDKDGDGDESNKNDDGKTNHLFEGSESDSSEDNAVESHDLRHMWGLPNFPTPSSKATTNSQVLAHWHSSKSHPNPPMYMHSHLLG